MPGGGGRRGLTHSTLVESIKPHPAFFPHTVNIYIKNTQIVVGKNEKILLPEVCHA